MISLSELFDLNRRLELARSLRWLAAFGIAHGFHEWGDLFIPIQTMYLNAQTINGLYTVHLVLLGLSFIFLFEFGMALLYPSKRGQWIHGITALLFLTWMIVALVILPAQIPNEQILRYTANALARYFIGFPGGLLAAYGIHRHTLQRIVPLNVPKIARTFQVVAVFLGIYAILGGLIPPPVHFFPGNIVNRTTFTEFVGIPPLVFRSLAGLVIAVTLIRALEIFNLETERRIETLEQYQIISAEQERLARDLHDGAIQKVYTAGLLIESAARLAEPESELDIRLKRAVNVLSDSILDLRRNLSELHSHTQTVQQPLPELLQKVAENPHYNTMVHIAIDDELPADKSISAARSGHIVSIVNEAMANTVRHAKARNVNIATRDLGEFLQIQIRDDGQGLPPDAKNGYGLRNMRDRARLLNGKINFQNDKGLVVNLEIPWKDQ